VRLRLALLRDVLRDCGGLALIEFALSLPLLFGLLMSGLEIANYELANNKIQRLATMMANLLAQNGDGPIAATEAQVYDLFTALDISAKPYDIRNSGRVVLTVVKGVDTSGNGTIQNQIVNQQFDGGLTSALPVLGCHTTNIVPTYSRTLAKDEVMIHAQVSYRYATLFPVRVYDMLNLPTIVTRTAAFRARSKDFDVSPDSNHPDKGNCTSATGL
jgi:Flp pilus assembly protein TadG